MYKYSLLLILWVSLLSAASVEELFAKGNEFYKNKSYDSAALCYDEALALEVNSVLLYNRGNCAYRLGKLGEAILLYERSLLRAPDNSDVVKSLAFVETQIVDKKIEEELGLFQRTLSFVQNIVPLPVQFWLLFLLSLLIAVMLYFVLFRRGNRRVMYIYICGIILFVYLLLGSSVLVKVIQSEENSYAIILTKSSDAVNEPLGKTVIFSAHEGTKVAIIKNGGEWIQVALNNGSTGWMRRKDLGFIQ